MPYRGYIATRGISIVVMPDRGYIAMRGISIVIMPYRGYIRVASISSSRHIVGTYEGHRSCHIVGIYEGHRYRQNAISWVHTRGIAIVIMPYRGYIRRASLSSSCHFAIDIAARRHHYFAVIVY